MLLWNVLFFFLLLGVLARVPFGGDPCAGVGRMEDSGWRVGSFESLMEVHSSSLAGIVSV